MHRTAHGSTDPEGQNPVILFVIGVSDTLSRYNAPFSLIINATVMNLPLNINAHFQQGHITWPHSHFRP
jgi:hypothetical protein